MAMFTLIEKSNAPSLIFFVKWFPRLVYLAGGISFFISFFLSENFVGSSLILNGISNFIGGIVPAIFRLSAVTNFPAKTAAIFSILWIFTPIYFALLVSVVRFWNYSNVQTMRARIKNFNPVMGFVICPALFMVFIISDFGIIQGISVFRMSGISSLVEYSPQLKLIISHPVSMMVYLWTLCGAEAFFYAYVICSWGSMLCLVWHKLTHLRHPVHP